jgi:RHS repeat-associated protein
MRCLAPFKKDMLLKITITGSVLSVSQIFRPNSNRQLKTSDWVPLLSPKTKTKCLCYQRPRPVRYHPGLYRFRHRDYSPTLGRWTTQDPLGFAAGDVNLYRTVFNAPTVYTDPSGESIFGKGVVKIVRLLKRGMKVIARNIGFDDAVRAVREGEDVLAPTRKMAHDIAKKAGGGRPPVHDPPHGPVHEGYRPHYHAAGRPEGFGHVFYEIAGVVTFSYWAEGHGSAAEWGAEALDLVNPLSLPKDILDLGHELTNW